MFFFLVGKPIRLPRLVLFRHFYTNSFLFTFTFGSDDGKLNSFPWNLGRFTILLDREISGDLLSLICGMEYSIQRIYVVGVHFVHAASCRGTEKEKKK